MNRECFVGVSALCRNVLDRPNHEKISNGSFEVFHTPSDSLLSIIYAPDERTGLPTGDLTYFVSDKANEDVKKFILDNLMQDVSVAKNVTNPSGLSDDALLELSRGANESVDEYCLRLNSEIQNFKFYKEQLSKNEVKDDVSLKSE